MSPVSWKKIPNPNTWLLWSKLHKRRNH